MTLVGVIASSSSAHAGMWLSTTEIRALPTSGAAWDAVKKAADAPLSASDANLADRNDHNIGTLAAALVGVRLDDDAYRNKAKSALADVMAQQPRRDDVLAAARKLAAYVIAADTLELSATDPAFDQRFRTWLRSMLTYEYSGGGGGGSIVDVHERRANNFGTHAGAARVAAAAYLHDQAELDRAAAVFRGWLGERQAYADFKYGDLAWQADPNRPVGVNPAGATRNGHSIDGVLPDDQRRGGGFTWPPPKENYVWGALQGATVQAQLLARQGYDAWGWGDAALLRAGRWLHEQADFPASGDDAWVPWLLNHAYGTSFPASHADGKNMAFTGWTHANRGSVKVTKAAPAVDEAPVEATAEAEATAEPETTSAEPEGETAAVEAVEATVETSAASDGDAVHLASGRSKGAAGVTSDAVAPRAGALHVVVVSTKPDARVAAVDGLGLDWRRVVEQCSGRGQTSVAVWVGSGEPQSGHVAVRLDRSTVNASLAVLAVDGATVAQAVGANTNGVGGACKHGSDSASYGVGSASGDGTVLVAATTRAVPHQAGRGLTEVVELHSGKGGAAAGLAVATTSGRGDLAGAFAKHIDWAAVAVRLR